MKRRRPNNEIESEIDFHIASLAEEFQRQGLSEADALARARLEFGGVDKFTEAARDESRWAWTHSLVQDVRFGLRMLRKTPVVTAAAVLSLALGIGATTAIYSLADRLLWRSLPAPAPEELGEIFWRSHKEPEGLIQGSSGSNFKDGAMLRADYFSGQCFEALRNSAGLPGEVAAHYGSRDVSVSYGQVTAVVALRPVSGNFFPLLRLLPRQGRLLAPADDNPAAPAMVVVTHRFWQSALGGDAGAVGRAMKVNNRLHTIAGVLDKEFTGLVAGESTDLYSALAHNPDLFGTDDWLRRMHNSPLTWHLQLIGRRAPEVSREAFEAAVDQVFRSTWPAQPKSPEQTPRVLVQDASRGLGSVRREFGSPFAMLMTLVVLVLLIACANIANLLLARGGARRQEVAMRISLGCGRARLIRQFLTESWLLAMIGGSLSLAAAYWLSNFMVRLLPSDQGAVRLDLPLLEARTILLTLVASALTTLVFGLYPAWRAARVEPSPALKEDAARPGASGGGHRWLTPGKLLVITQVALGVLLVSAAAGFTARLRDLVNRDPGFERTRLLLFDVRPGQTGYTGPRLRQFYFDLQARLQAAPGVEAVSFAQTRPMRGGGYWDRVGRPGYGKEEPSASHLVTGDFLRVMRIGIVDGRGLSERDVQSGAAVAVISQDLAGKLGVRPGMQVRQGRKLLEVVGVARRARYADMEQTVNVIYRPHPLDQESFTVVLRTRVAPLQVLAGVRKAVAELDRDLPIIEPATMEQQIGSTLRRERLFAWLCGSFGVLALVLCVVGLYGVMSYTAARRRREIGIRIALGATAGHVLRRVLGEGMGVTALGLAVGGPLAYYGAAAWWPSSISLSALTVAIGALGAAAFVAVLVPAARAAAADPMRALREG